LLVVAQRPLEDVMKRLGVGECHHRLEPATEQGGAIVAQEPRRGDVEIADDPVGVQREVGHRREVVQLDVALMGFLELFLRLAKRLVLQLELHLMDTQLVQQPVGLVE
jgi:hypothetical protein